MQAQLQLRRRLPLPATCLIAACIALAAVTFAPARAGAIIGGQLDGSAHPYVAAIGQPDGQGIYFTGTLISPTVVLTAAHAVVRLEKLGFTTARLTFASAVSAASAWHVGAIHVDPAYAPADTTDPNDLAVIVLDAPITTIAPASLPSEGLLDQLATEAPRATFDMVGDGISAFSGGANGGGKTSLDFGSTGTRHVAEGSLGSTTDAWLRLQLEGGAEGCIGDSGSPSLVAGSDVIAGIFILEDSIDGAQCVSQPWDMRVDTPDARDFLGQYVTLP